MKPIPLFPAPSIMPIISNLSVIKTSITELQITSILNPGFYSSILIELKKSQTTSQSQLNQLLKTTITQLLAALYPNPKQYTATQISQFTLSLTQLIQTELANCIAITNPIYPPIIAASLTQQSAQSALSTITLSFQNNPLFSKNILTILQNNLKKELQTAKSTIKNQVQLLSTSTSTTPATINKIVQSTLNYIQNDFPPLYSAYILYQATLSPMNIFSNQLLLYKKSYQKLLYEFAANRLLELYLFPNLTFTYTAGQIPIILQGIIIPCLEYKLQYIMQKYPTYTGSSGSSSGYNYKISTSTIVTGALTGLGLIAAIIGSSATLLSAPSTDDTIVTIYQSAVPLSINAKVAAASAASASSAADTAASTARSAASAARAAANAGTVSDAYATQAENLASQAESTALVAKNEAISAQDFAQSADDNLDNILTSTTAANAQTFADSVSTYANSATTASANTTAATFKTGVAALRIYNNAGTNPGSEAIAAGDAGNDAITISSQDPTFTQTTLPSTQAELDWATNLKNGQFSTTSLLSNPLTDPSTTSIIESPIAASINDALSQQAIQAAEDEEYEQTDLDNANDTEGTEMLVGGDGGGGGDGAGDGVVADDSPDIFDIISDAFIALFA